MPIDYKRYPANWKSEIRPFILERAKHHCEWCGFEDRQIIHRAKRGDKIYWFATEEQAKTDCDPILYFGTATVILTVAHLDHDETNPNVKLDRLAALCQRCHLRYDAKEKSRRVLNGYDRTYKIDYPPDLPGEIWVAIRGYENEYEVSNKARIRTLSLLSNKRGSFYLEKFQNRKGYNIVSLWRNGRQNTKKVYRLVAEAFLDNPLNLPEVNHKKGKQNDLPESIEWSNASDNQKHAYRTGLRKSTYTGTDNWGCKLTESQVLEIFSSTLTTKPLTEIYNVSKACIQKIRAGRTWSHITGKFHHAKLKNAS